MADLYRVGVAIPTSIGNKVAVNKLDIFLPIHLF